MNVLWPLNKTIIYYIIPIYYRDYYFKPTEFRTSDLKSFLQFPLLVILRAHLCPRYSYVLLFLLYLIIGAGILIYGGLTVKEREK